MNAAQQQAVMHAKGPAMVLAGPGSGKTTVITERLRYLIEQKAVDPASILVITFTKASAIEMQIRFLKLSDNSYPQVLFGTFHSVFYQIIRDSISNKNTGLLIADIKFQTEIIRDILSELKAHGKITRQEYDEGCENIPDILSEISRIKNLDIDPEQAGMSIPLAGVFPDIFTSYGKKLREFGRIDFDDMIVRCLNLLTQNASILKKWQQRFRFILIDEYQDINPVQSKIVDLLLGEEKNLFAVGDDDQSIYGFRGSDPAIMLAFNEKFASCGGRVINLDINYRSGSEILNASKLVIAENKKRLDKNLAAFEGNKKGGVHAQCH
jgi:DNA helicase-2/ATP-dependent DNA helicase PcrA